MNKDIIKHYELFLKNKLSVEEQLTLAYELACHIGYSDGHMTVRPSEHYKIHADRVWSYVDGLQHKWMESRINLTCSLKDATAFDMEEAEKAIKEDIKTFHRVLTELENGIKTKTIHIHMSRSPQNALSYLQVKEAIDKEQETIYTCCIDFFSTSVFQKGYEVIVYKDDEMMSLIELMLHSNKHNYTDKDIRLAHNLPKMLKANYFTFKKNPHLFDSDKFNKSS
jgi:hypothetical protein